MQSHSHHDREISTHFHRPGDCATIFIDSTARYSSHCRSHDAERLGTGRVYRQNYLTSASADRKTGKEALVF